MTFCISPLDSSEQLSYSTRIKEGSGHVHTSLKSKLQTEWEDNEEEDEEEKEGDEEIRTVC